MKKKKMLAVIMAALFTFSTAAYAAQEVTSSDVTIVNNYGATDTVTMVANSGTDLKAGDTVKLYKANGTTVITTTKAAIVNGTTTAAISKVQVSADATGQAGTVKVQIVRGTATPPTPTTINFTAEPQTTALVSGNVTIVNQANDGSDSITVSNVAKGSIVKVYMVNTTTAAAISTMTSTSAAVALKATYSGSKLLDDGTVYLTVKDTDKTESAKTPFTYSDATQLTLGSSDVTIENNVDANKQDIITATTSIKGDVLKAYSDAAATKLIASATAPSNTTPAAIKLGQGKLASAGGNVYLTLSRKGSTTSTVLTKAYAAEVQTTAPALSDISIYNFGDGVKDVITVKNVAATDKIAVYTDATTTAAAVKLVLPTAVKAGKQSITIQIPKALTAAGGDVWVTVKKVNQLESTRTKVTYTAELQ